jgi:hypothetical protein
MISVRTITYETSSKPNEIISRIGWEVEKVDSLLNAQLNSMTAETNKKWTGVVNKDSNQFNIMEPGKFFGIKMFQIFLRGKVIESDSGIEVKIKFIPGLYLFLCLIFLYSATALMIGGFISLQTTESIGSFLLWLLVFPLLGTYLLIRKLNKLEKRIESVMDLQ